MNATDREKELARRVVETLYPDYNAKMVKDKIYDPERSNWRDSRYGVGVEIVRKQKYSLPTEEDGFVVEIEFNSMYDSGAPEFTFEVLEKLANLFGSKKINIGTPEGLSSGCDTCGHGGHHRLSVFVHDPTREWIVGPERPAPVSKTQVL